MGHCLLVKDGREDRVPSGWVSVGVLALLACLSWMRHRGLHVSS